MKRIGTAAVLIPLVVLIVLRAPLWLFASVTAGVAMLATREFLEIVKGYGAEPSRMLSLVVAILSCFFVPVEPLAAMTLQSFAIHNWPASQFATLSVVTAIRVIMVTLPLWLLLTGLREKEIKRAVPNALFSAAGYFYIAVPLALLVAVEAAPSGRFLVAFLFAAVWVGDAAAYYVGKSIGRHFLAPRISPKKTWEGSVASVFGSMVVGILAWHAWISLASPSHAPQSILDLKNIWICLVLAIAINIAAQLGDLVESMMKRGADIKDSGAILPGHGGMLDRIDALLFAIPVMWYYSVLRTALTAHFYTPS